MEINKKIEHYTQQRYLITYASKGKRKLQTPAVTPRKIQPPTWKKNRIESPSNPFYYYTPESAINILSTDTFPSTVTSAFGQFPFQSRQRKTELLGPYGKYFEGFNSQSSIPSRLRSLLPLPDFGISDPWEAAESEKKEEKSENQEFTYQNPITENPENNSNSELINQQNLPLVIIINQLPINPIAEPIQQPSQLSPQQPVQQQLLQQPPQPPNLDPMAYAPIAKLDNFTGEKDDAQVWLNDVEKAIAANGWNDARAIQAISYFLKDTTDSYINCLVNTFTTMKQGETKVVTTYLGHFHRNLHQIQAIDTNYFTVLQILNQFIHGLRSSILQYVHPLYLDTLQDAVTCARDFESTESEANHTQAVNLVMNGSSELDSKLEKFIPKSKPTHLLTSDAVISLSTSGVSSSNLSTAVTSNLSTTTATNNLSVPTNPNTTPKLTTQWNPKTKNDSTALEISDSSSSTDPQFFTATIWIMPVEFGYWSTPKPEFPELFKSSVNATLDWNTQKLQLTYQGQHIHVPVMCGHFKTSSREKLLIKLEEEKEKPIWEAYQVFWADANHNELPPILSWNDNPKRKQKEELTWETDNLT
ncbi:hypothetical protein G9A89_012068 [Geosiphon pyriformis]|nr:hypothetical protein G9A89_012068 [Geosiphon pyriformis]